MKTLPAYELWKAEGRAFARSPELRMGRTFEQIEKAAVLFAQGRPWCAHPI